MAKDNAIETLRGVAIILVVGLHITNDGAITPSREFYDYLAYTFQNIRIPLFTVISGYLYGLRPVFNGGYYSFLKGKGRRILIPLFVVVTLQFSLKSFLPGVNEPSDISKILIAYVYPYEHFWFLQAIFLIFVIVGFLDQFRVLYTFNRWGSFLLISLIWFLIYPYTGLDLPWFSIGTTGYIFPYFLFGYGIARFNDRILSKAVIKWWVSIFLLAILIQQVAWLCENPSLASKRSVIGLAVSISGCAVLFYFRRPVIGLSTVGSFAFTIYLYQGFGTSFGRRVLDLLPQAGPHFYFISVVGIALLLGMAVEMIFSRVPKLRTLMLGLK